jgi:hypothetical protein
MVLKIFEFPEKTSQMGCGKKLVLKIFNESNYFTPSLKNIFQKNLPNGGAAKN